MNPIDQPSPLRRHVSMWAPSVAVAFVLGALGVGLYFYFKPEPAPTAVHLPANDAPQVARETRVEVPITAPIKVYRPEVKKKLKLPDAIQQNASQHVIASSRTAGDERPHTITTVIDANTGETTTLDRVEPLPWLAVSTKTEIAAFYGVKNGEPAFRVQAQQEMLRVKALHLGAVASADVVRGDIDTFVGVGVWARW